MILTVIGIAGVGLILAFAGSLTARRHRLTTAAAVGIGVTGLFASYSGFLLPWDQLARRAVTVGSDLRGARAAFGRQVEEVFVGGATISSSTYRAWVYVHVAAVPVLLVGLGLVAAWRLRQPVRGVRARRAVRQVPSGLSRRDEPDGHTGLGS